MADIKVKDLATHNISGSDLFQDSENFMVELGDEIEEINGGIRPAVTTDLVCIWLTLGASRMH
jgi:hypothetical protein